MDHNKIKLKISRSSTNFKIVDNVFQDDKTNLNKSNITETGQCKMRLTDFLQETNQPYLYTHITKFRIKLLLTCAVAQACWQLPNLCVNSSYIVLVERP